MCAKIYTPYDSFILIVTIQSTHHVILLFFYFLLYEYLSVDRFNLIIYIQNSNIGLPRRAR